MQYQRQSVWREIGLEYTLEYDPDAFQADSGVSGEIRLKRMDEGLGAIDVSPPKGVSIDEEFSENDCKTVLFSSDSEQQSNESYILVESSSTSPPNEIYIEVPDEEVFRISSFLIDKKNIDKAIEKINYRYEGSTTAEALSSFQGDIEEILPFKTYIDVLNIISGYDKRFSDFVNGYEARYGYFRSRAINERKPYSVDSLSGLAGKLAIYNSKENLQQVQLERLIVRIYVELAKRAQNSGYNYVKSDIMRLFPDSKGEYLLLERRSISIAVALLRLSRGKSVADELLSDWKEANGVSLEKTLQSRPFVHDEIESSIQTNTGNFLCATAADLIQNGNHLGIIPILRGAEVDTEGQLNSVCSFLLNHAEAYDILQDCPEQAAKIFDNAFEVLENSDFRDIYLHYGDQVRKLYSGKAKAVIWNSEEIEIVEANLKELIERAESDKVPNQVIEEIQGWRWEMVAKENLRQGELDLAKDNFSKSEQYFSNSSVDSAKLSVIVQRKSIIAVELELKQQFGDAADVYEEIAEICANGMKNYSTAKAFGIRSRYAEVKKNILNRDLGAASEELNIISERMGASGAETRILNELIKRVEDYMAGDITDRENIEAVIVGERSGTLPAVKQDYGSTLSILEAAQYMREYGVSENILDPIIKIGLEDGFTPKFPESGINAFTGQEPTQEIDIDIAEKERQRNLPSQIHYQLEKVKIDQATSGDDVSGLAVELVRTVEILFAVFFEYYGKNHYGDDWEASIWEAKDDIGNISLGQFLYSAGDDALPTEEKFVDAIESLKSELAGKQNIVHYRNDLGHGSHIKVSRNEYDPLESIVTSFFNDVSRYCPIIIECRQEIEFGWYLCVVHDGSLTRQMWVQTDSDLAKDEMYYLPPSINQSEYLVEVDGSKIEACEAERARTVSEVKDMS